MEQERGLGQGQEREQERELEREREQERERERERELEQEREREREQELERELEREQEQELERELEREREQEPMKDFFKPEDCDATFGDGYVAISLAKANSMLNAYIQTLEKVYGTTKENREYHGVPLFWHQGETTCGPADTHTARLIDIQKLDEP